jgi:Flavodoxins
LPCIYRRTWRRTRRPWWRRFLKPTPLLCPKQMQWFWSVTPTMTASYRTKHWTFTRI